MIWKPVEGALIRVEHEKSVQQHGFLGLRLLFLFSFFRVVKDGERVISPNRRVQVVYPLVDFVAQMSGKLARVFIANARARAERSATWSPAELFRSFPTCARTAARSPRSAAMMFAGWGRSYHNCRWP